jgi:hypothetical protein
MRDNAVYVHTNPLLLFTFLAPFAKSTGAWREMRHPTRPAMSELLACAVPLEVKQAVDALAAREAMKTSEIMRRASVKELRAVGILKGGERARESRPVAAYA